MRNGRLLIHMAIWLAGAVLALAANQGVVLLLPALLSLLVEARARRRQASDIPYRNARLGSAPESGVTAAPHSMRVDGAVTIKGNVIGGSMISAEDAALLDDSRTVPGERSGGIEIAGNVVVGGDLVGGDKIVIGRQAAISLADWLPTNCPNCGGTLSTATVKNSTATTADCPFCGTQLRPLLTL